jgi:competence protein ComFB
MAKKSNKTEHVLKLITKNEDAAQDDVYFAIEDIKENGTSAIKSEILSEPGDMEDEIELGLERLLRNEPFEPVPPAEAAVSPEPETEIPDSEDEAVEEEQAQEAEPEQPKQTEAAQQPKPEKLPDESAPQESPAMRAFREQENLLNMIPESAEELINIAEVLAREKLTLVMDRMKVCTCKTCVNDVLALALNTLPTKYVTTDAGKQYFQRDEYKKQYETEILAALTKACVRVKAAPRHQQ